MNEFGNLVRTLRRKQGLTQAQLAEQSNFNKDTIVKWEVGKMSPRLDSAEAIMGELGWELIFKKKEAPSTKDSAGKANERKCLK